MGYSRFISWLISNWYACGRDHKHVSAFQHGDQVHLKLGHAHKEEEEEGEEEEKKKEGEIIGGKKLGPTPNKI